MTNYLEIILYDQTDKGGKNGSALEKSAESIPVNVAVNVVVYHTF